METGFVTTKIFVDVKIFLSVAYVLISTTVFPSSKSQGKCAIKGKEGKGTKTKFAIILTENIKITVPTQREGMLWKCYYKK